MGQWLGEGGSVLTGDRVSVREDEKVLEMTAVIAA